MNRRRVIRNADHPYFLNEYRDFRCSDVTKRCGTSGALLSNFRARA
jgi:hypothetical protein